MGFYPLGVAPAELTRLRAIMTESAEKAGRDPRAIEISLLGTPDAASAHSVHDLGASRMVIAALDGDLARLGVTLERFRRDVMERF